MTDNIARINQLNKFLKKAKADPLLKFMSEPYHDELALLREKCFQDLKALCKKYKVRYIVVDESEICGCENARDEHGWPAMWTIGNQLGLPPACGNRDQRQYFSEYKYFPDDTYGTWDMEENRKLTIEEEATKNFRRVVTRKQ